MVRRAYERIGSLSGDLKAVVARRDEEEAVAEARGLDEHVGRRSAKSSSTPTQHVLHIRVAEWRQAI